ncbi:MAG: glucuronate isomerase, partial [Oscillospiraceae bacterium]|nr:glucuronate isomerase [Oscillospiraceae bacterium]
MRAFMDKDFLLETETAKHLFHDFSEHQPLIDYHCHISPREIYENRRFNNLVEVWLGGRNPDGSYFGDHYKWRVMRSNGVSEDYVTGDKPAYERFEKFVEALQLANGNPLYHWCHLELRQFFGYDTPLPPATAREAWDWCNDKLQNDPSLTVRGIIEKANVAMVGTTDDPIDSLEWHEKIAADPSIKVKVCPSFRPDKAINISKPGFAEYIGKLAQSVGKDRLNTVGEVCDALVERLEFFAKMGCRASDHGLDYIPCRVAEPAEINAVFARVMKGESISVEDAEKYQTAILMCLGKAYHRLNIAMQLHYSCYRNANERMYEKLGPDTGFDMIAQTTCGIQIAQFLSALDKTGECPKTILYSLNGVVNDMLGTMLGCLQGTEVPGKIQL